MASKGSVRVRVTGSYKGRKLVAEFNDYYWDPADLYRDDSGTPGKPFMLNEFWWTEGNFSCDCNRVMCVFKELTPEAAPELYHLEGSTFQDGSACDQTHERCGDLVCIDRIEPIDNDQVAPLILNESEVEA